VVYEGRRDLDVVGWCVLSFTDKIVVVCIDKQSEKLNLVVLISRFLQELLRVSEEVIPGFADYAFGMKHGNVCVD
jgi:flavin reductase (DIM6/NTAB) family NADH-FMN oxidoreductase RutF